jgi:hypothetical protein
MGALQDEIKSYFDEYYGGDSSALQQVGEKLKRVDVGYGAYTQPTQSSTPTSSNKNYSKLLGADKYASIQRKANEWGKDADAIAGIIWAESKGNTQAVNKTSGATGIIQFMNSTAKGLGTTQEDILNMDFEQQLDLTGKYFQGFGKRWDNAKTATDLYALVFYPEMSGKAGDYVLGSTKGTDFANKVAKQNKIFDLNNDNQITKAEFDEWGAAKLKHGGIIYK